MRNKITYISQHPFTDDDILNLQEAKCNHISFPGGLNFDLNYPNFDYDNIMYRIAKDSKLNKREIQLINQYKKKFISEVNNWERIFKKARAKIYLTSYFWSPSSISAAIAIKKNEGISFVLQSSYHEIPSVDSTVFADVLFSFSNKAPHVHGKDGSQIKYNVCIGYIGSSKNYKYVELYDL